MTDLTPLESSVGDVQRPHVGQIGQLVVRPSVVVVNSVTRDEGRKKEEQIREHAKHDNDQRKTKTKTPELTGYASVSKPEMMLINPVLGCRATKQPFLEKPRPTSSMTKAQQ